MRGVITVQLCLLGAATMIPFLPPAEGSMLIIPLAPTTGAHSFAWASVTGARLLKAGPLPGSYFVEAKRSELLGPALAHGALLVGIEFAGCTTSGKKSYVE
ncbi:MAG: hypothetical protein V4472_14205 [Pseudomonadota bacterium]